jgi:hypothetical protein
MQFAEFFKTVAFVIILNCLKYLKKDYFLLEETSNKLKHTVIAVVKIDLRYRNQIHH